MIENALNRKVILLGLPKSFGFSSLIARHLESAGYKVIDICFNDYDFQYNSIRQKLTNLFRKLFLRDKNYKGKLKFRPIEKEVLFQLDQVDVIDFALLIRGDIYPKKILNIIRQKAIKAFDYQWDGIERYPLILERVSYFDKIYAFDPHDIVKYGFSPLTNFYFPRNLPDNKEKKSFEKKALFLGSCFKDRFEHLEEISKVLSKNAWDFTCLLYGKEKPNLTFSYAYLNTPISYEEYLTLLDSFDLLIDNSINVHYGLSFRVFESIGYEKKLITNNPTVAYYDFYLPNNILIIKDLINYEKISSFLNLPYVPLPKSVKEKYSFKNWLHNILAVEPKIDIQLPSIISTK